MILLPNIVFSQTNTFSFCNGFGITCPQGLDAHLINSNIAHRFYGPISQGADTLWGMDSGANIMLYASYTLTDYDKIHIQRISQNKDIQIGYQRSKQFYLLPLFAMIQFNANWYEDNNQRIFNGLTLVGLSYEFLSSQIHINYGYDHYSGHSGFGSALVFSFLNDWDFVFEGFSTNQKNDNSLSAGIVYHTFGHRFKLGIHNSTNMGFRQLIQGTSNKDWVLGFQIHRLLAL